MRAVDHQHFFYGLAILLVVCLAASLAGPPASALVYFTTQGGYLGRANLNGTTVDTHWILSSGFPTGIAVDAGHVYWTRFLGDTLGRANIDGSMPFNNWISGPDGPNGIAVNGTYVYWANTVTSTIGRANLDGSGADPTWLSSAAMTPTGIAVDGNYIYWSNYNGPLDSIGRANIDGTNVIDDFISGTTNPSGIAVDGSHIYWTNIGPGGTIGRANLDGSGVNQDFISGVVNAIGMAVDANFIYWTTTDDIGRANIDGSGADASWISDVGSNTRGVTVDETATPVTLTTFTAHGVRGGIKVLWETAAEFDLAGFHVWRCSAKDEAFERVTEGMIPAQGGPLQGAAYSWLDTATDPGTRYWYKLEAIDYSGVSAFHGPVRALMVKKG